MKRRTFLFNLIAAIIAAFWMCGLKLCGAQPRAEIEGLPDGWEMINDEEPPRCFDDDMVALVIWNKGSGETKAVLAIKESLEIMGEIRWEKYMELLERDDGIDPYVGNPLGMWHPFKERSFEHTI